MDTTNQKEHEKDLKRYLRKVFTKYDKLWQKRFKWLDNEIYRLGKCYIDDLFDLMEQAQKKDRDEIHRIWKVYRGDLFELIESLGPNWYEDYLLSRERESIYTLLNFYFKKHFPLQCP